MWLAHLGQNHSARFVFCVCVLAGVGGVFNAHFFFLYVSSILFSSPLAIPGTTSYCPSISGPERCSRMEGIPGSLRKPWDLSKWGAQQASSGFLWAEGHLRESEGRASGEALRLPPVCRRTAAPLAAVTLSCVPVTGAFSDTVNTGLSSFWRHMKEKRDLCPHVRITVRS